ncbi:hypothetical protein SAMN05192561_1235 [Halopenitus malekzadehii]|uniref:Tautomerase enzyme n=1 Tax=Halopenitus malekzadehii TaxID=1267564 RepID=A0A1H6K393_9EURY|nr:tautomerase [Halopenitus malekzadehii]SEH65867.1 hypothetical protein SAMN05192561_1235 [Halopenitus malekzadehii]
MPHLALDTTADPTAADRRAFTEAVTDIYGAEMRTSTGHIAVTIREHPPSAMSLGRAVEGPLAVLDADVRRGRSFERRRAFALAVIDWLAAEWAVPRPNGKIVFTEHDGDQLMGADRVGEDWSPDEADQ